jgi:hypothetical protein
MELTLSSSETLPDGSRNEALGLKEQKASSFVCVTPTILTMGAIAYPT